MNGISELVIGIVIINVVISIIRSIQKGKQAKTGAPPKEKATKKDLLREFLEGEDLVKKVSTRIEGLVEGRTERPPQGIAREDAEFVAPETGEISGIDERRRVWREDMFEAKEQEAAPEAPTTWDMLPSYDEVYRKAEIPVQPTKAAKPIRPPREITARRAVKAEARKVRERIARPGEEEPIKRRAETIFESLKGRSSLQRAIVLSEILGPCRAKRRWFRRF